MDALKVLFDLYEQQLFTYIGATSWFDLAECLFAYAFVFFLFFITILLPLSLFGFLFLSPML